MSEPLLIIHHSDCEVQIIPPIRARDFLYACGDTLEPRYPVPAIRYDAAFVPYVHPVWTAGKRIIALGIFNISRYPGMIADKYWLK